MFKKRFDYNNPNTFNLTIGDEAYYENKFNNKLPDGYCSLLEVLTLKKYSDEVVDNVISNIKLKNQKFIEQIDKEFESRAKLNNEEEKKSLVGE